MHYRADSTALNLVKDYCIDSAQEAMKHNVCEDPTSSAFLEHLFPFDITDDPGLHAIFDEHGNLIKIGSTTSLLLRKQDYDLNKYRFYTILSLDAMTREFNLIMETNYSAMMKTLSEHQDLHPFQHSIYKSLVENGGDKLGPKKNIFLQILELGFQYYCKGTTSVEFIMFEKFKLQAMYDFVNDETAKAINCLLSFLPIEAHDPSVRYSHSKASWNTGSKPEISSSQIMATQCVLGNRNSKNWSDTIPKPAVPNGNNRNEIFFASLLIRNLCRRQR